MAGRVKRLTFLEVLNEDGLRKEWEHSQQFGTARTEKQLKKKGGGWELEIDIWESLACK